MPELWTVKMLPRLHIQEELALLTNSRSKTSERWLKGTFRIHRLHTREEEEFRSVYRGTGTAISCRVTESLTSEPGTEARKGRERLVHTELA